MNCNLGKILDPSRRAAKLATLGGVGVHSTNSRDDFPIRDLVAAFASVESDFLRAHAAQRPSAGSMGHHPKFKGERKYG